MTLAETVERVTHPRAVKDTTLRDWVRALEATAPIAAHPQRTLLTIIEDLARKQGGAPALVSAGESLTYGALVARANRYARWALANGLGKGDVVALLLPNRPEYMAVWLGLSAVGVVVALINTQLRGAALAHSLKVAAPKHIIAAAEFCVELRGAKAQTCGVKIWSHGDDNFNHTFDQISDMPLMQSERRSVTIADTALLIYTSGTTGLPKAARVSHRRLLQWSFWFAGLMDTKPNDRMYDCLPMYHSVGGIVATGALLVRGGSVLIRDGFSARRFWDDVVDGGCTLFQYIGELARYLLNAPAHPRERTHRLRLACGNGLSAEVWEKFQSRFAIPRVLEFYAATEANFSLYNVEGKVGSVGRVPPFLAHRLPVALVKFDVTTGEPTRDAAGFCIRCATGEIGEAIGKIGDDPSLPGGAFEGYTNTRDTEKKTLRDVFEHGDAWYRTGDLMRADASGFFYFIDRIGDTFRWKGENVSTSEVEAAICAFPGIKEACVYGVSIPRADGSAGMAAIVCNGALKLDELREHLARQLPAYARPKFLRVTNAIATTGTFKQSKAELRRQGFDPAATTDPIYADDPTAKAYVRLDVELHAGIVAGAICL